MTFALALAAGPAAPHLVGPAAPIGPNDAVTLVLSGAGTTFVDGCRPVEWEQKEKEEWKAVKRDDCAGQKPATAVHGSLTLSLPPLNPGEYRALVAWGSGCSTTLPLALGACKKLDFVRSESIVVHAAP